MSLPYDLKQDVGKVPWANEHPIKENSMSKPGWVVAVDKERVELIGKIHSLSGFLGSPDSKSVTFPHRILLMAQLDVMKQYRALLTARLRLS